MNCANWENVSKQVNLGIHCTDPQSGPVDFSIRVREFNTLEAYPEDVRARAKIIKEAFRDIDVINESWAERDSRDLLGDRNFTYGEVRFASFYPLLKMAKPQAGEVFYDLGCGTGLPSAIAAVMFP